MTCREKLKLERPDRVSSEFTPARKPTYRSCR